MSREAGATGSAIVLLLGLGVAFDLAFHGQYFGVSTPLYFSLVSAALVRVVREPRTRALLGAATVFAVFPSLRAATGLVALDLLAVAALLGTAVALDARDVLRASTVSLVLVLSRLLRSALAVPRYLLRPLAPAARLARLDRARPALRTAAVAAPVILIFAALLGSADRVFADVITPAFPHWDVGSMAGHVFLTLAGTFLVATLWHTAIQPRTVTASDLPPIAEQLPKAGVAQWSAALGGVVALFAVFVGVQFAFLFGGRHRVLVTPGLTYAEYARSGFFQLIAVAALTVGLILAAWDLGLRPDRMWERRFRATVTGIVGLAFVILGSALTRLRLYEHTFGFTINRFYAYVAIAWIGVVLIAVLACVWTGRRDRVLASAAAAALVALLFVNVMNPERFVAERNVARWRATGKIDVAYLGWGLGPDAVPVAVTLLRKLDAERASELRAALCERRHSLGAEPGWRSVNLGRAEARRALVRAGISDAACAARDRP